jgi:hypothetical protein
VRVRTLPHTRGYTNNQNLYEHVLGKVRVKKKRIGTEFVRKVILMTLKKGDTYDVKEIYGKSSLISSCDGAKGMYISEALL